MSAKRKIVSTAAAAPAVVFVTLAVLTAAPPAAHAGKGAAFIGGLIGGHVLTNMADRAERRTRAEEYQAYAPRPAPVYQAQPAPAAPAAPAADSPQARLDTLDKLAAGGYITKEEYKSRRQAILDGM